MAVFYKVCVFSAIIIICLLLCKFNGFIDLGHMKITKRENIKKEYLNPLRNNNVVMIRFHLGLGTDGSIGIDLAAPYKNSAQKEQLLKQEARIKNDFIMYYDKDLKEWVKKRNFRAIKSEFTRIVNRYIDEPVKEVYISKFFYE